MLASASTRGASNGFLRGCELVGYAFDLMSRLSGDRDPPPALLFAGMAILMLLALCRLLGLE